MRALPSLQADDVVRVSNDGEWLRGRVLRPDVTPRSYVVETEEGSTLRRNRRDLIKTAEETPVSRVNRTVLDQGQSGASI